MRVSLNQFEEEAQLFEAESERVGELSGIMQASGEVDPGK